MSIIDVGTGAGFPGIPLKICLDSLELTLLDSLNKRINFLEEVSRVLELDNVTFIHGRAEDFGKNENYRENMMLLQQELLLDYRFLWNFVYHL